MPSTLGTAKGANSGGSAGTTLTVADFEAVATGNHLVFATTRSTLGTDTSGVASITIDTNSTTRHVAYANRNATLEVAIHLTPITDAIENLDDATITFNTGHTQRAAVGVPVLGMTSTKNGGTTGAPTTGATSVGSTNNTTAVTTSFSVTGAGTKRCFVAVAYGAGTITTPAGWTLVRNEQTGSRSVALFSREVTGATTVSFAATLGAASGWVACGAAYDVPADVVTPPTVNLVADDETAEPAQEIGLSATSSESSVSFSQIAGTTVTLTGSGLSRSFSAPIRLTQETLTFRASATNTAGTTTDDVSITVLPATELTVGAATVEGGRNGTFETDITGWSTTDAFSSYALATLSRDTTRFRTGAASLKAALPTSTKSSWVHMTNSFAVTAGEIIRFTGWVYVPTGSPDVRASVLFLAAGTPVTVKDQWALLDFYYVVATTGSIFLGVTTVGPGTAGQAFNIDDVVVSRASMSGLGVRLP